MEGGKRKQHHSHNTFCREGHMNDYGMKTYLTRQTDFLAMLEGALGSDTVISFPPIHSAKDDWEIQIRTKVNGRSARCRLSSEMMTNDRRNYEKVFAKRIDKIKKSLL
jgi:hypothetical protein